MDFLINIKHPLYILSVTFENAFMLKLIINYLKFLFWIFLRASSLPIAQAMCSFEYDRISLWIDTSLMVEYSHSSD